jgi:hypothetical protein
MGQVWARDQSKFYKFLLSFLFYDNLGKMVKFEGNPKFLSEVKSYCTQVTYFFFVPHRIDNWDGIVWHGLHFDDYHYNLQVHRTTPKHDTRASQGLNQGSHKD